MRKDTVSSRRQFLARAAAGAGAMAAAGGFAGCSSVSPQAQQASSPAQEHGHASPASAPSPHGDHFIFFTTPQGQTVDAIAERMIPTDALGPGAHDAGVVFYIDRALSGPYASLREVYRAGLAGVDAYSAATYGVPFLELNTERQDAVLRAMEEGKATGFTAPTAKAFFEMLWTHVREGLFCDPSHGGNRNFIGWKLLRHPGVQWEHPAPAQWKGYGKDLEMRAAGDWGFRR